MASGITSKYLPAILRSRSALRPSLPRPHVRLHRTAQSTGRRFAHAIPKPTANATSRKMLEPHYRLSFECVPCATRSEHVVTKQAYHKGSVLITCPACRNRHVISDNLNIFGDRKITIEDLLREKGQLVKRGTLGEDGDIEFWADTPADAGETKTEPEPEPEPEPGFASIQSEQQQQQQQEEEDHDQARMLRETRDPSSHSTDPNPSSASLLPGDAGTRPSVGSVSHQGPAPATRRQYSTRRFTAPTGLRTRGQTPLGRFGPLPGAEVHASTSNQTSGLVNPSDPGRLDAGRSTSFPSPELDGSATSLADDSLRDFVLEDRLAQTDKESAQADEATEGPWEQALRGKAHSRASAELRMRLRQTLQSEEMGMAPEYMPRPFVRRVRHIGKQLSDDPIEIRKIKQAPETWRLRLIPVSFGMRIQRQVRPGVIGRRPPGGVIEDVAPPPPYSPDAPLTMGAAPGRSFSRPSYLPIMRLW
ncbi:DNL zinc finger-domain-containing protein [Nemania sp. FL0916]|nr:DNL zinc finger-domain-containing protein [Nemania sp. FL0916]